jgi:hypothetical protein
MQIARGSLVTCFRDIRGFGLRGDRPHLADAGQLRTGIGISSPGGRGGRSPAPAYSFSPFVAARGVRRPGVRSSPFAPAAKWQRRDPIAFPCLGVSRPRNIPLPSKNRTCKVRLPDREDWATACSLFFAVQARHPGVFAFCPGSEMPSRHRGLSQPLISPTVQGGTGTPAGPPRSAHPIESFRTSRSDANYHPHI